MFLLLSHDDYTDRAWIGMITLSVVCHALFLSGAVFLPGLTFTRTRIPAAVEVDLVSLPAAQPRQGPSRHRPKSSGRVEPAKPQLPPEAVKIKDKSGEAGTPSSKETVSLSSAKPLRIKHSVKKRTYNASRAIGKAIAEIEKQASESRPTPVLDAIDELRKKDQAAGNPAGIGGVVAGIGEGTKKALELLDIYHAEIWDLIRRNWAYSKELDQGPSNPEAVIIVKIMRDGEVRDMWFEERSGSTYFDGSCLKAIKKSNPLPPLPDGFLKPFHEVGFRFNPSELQRRP